MAVLFISREVIGNGNSGGKTILCSLVLPAFSVSIMGRNPETTRMKWFKQKASLMKAYVLSQKRRGASGATQGENGMRVCLAREEE